MREYLLLNKDTIVAVFATDREGVLTIRDTAGRLPYGFKDIEDWVTNRKALKHNAHLRELMARMGCADNEGFIRVTHCAGINDTFWVKATGETLSWNDVSLYRNEFNEVVSRLAFEGAGIPEDLISSTSPELSCEGAFRKCFRKEQEKGQYGSDIFLYKRGSDIGRGLEHYGEVLASEIASVIAPDNSVRYDLTPIHGSLASRCNLFTDENIGYASYAKVMPHKPATIDFFKNAVFSEKDAETLAKMFVIDALTFNTDRHTGNFGYLFNNDTLDLISFSPVYDFNHAFLSFLSDEDLESVGDHIYNLQPKIGEDFVRIGQLFMTDSLRTLVDDLAGFTFSFRGDERFPETRVKSLESIVRKQALALMSKTPLFVYDVHFSDLHEEEAKQKDRANRASLVLTRFADRIDSAFEGEDLLYSVCDSTTCVIFQCELGKVVMTIDFLNNDIRFEKDEKPLAISSLRANLADSAAQKVTRMSGILTSVASAFSAPSDFRAKASALAEICAQFAKEPAQTANRNPAR